MKTIIHKESENQNLNVLKALSGLRDQNTKPKASPKNKRFPLNYPSEEDPTSVQKR